MGNTNCAPAVSESLSYFALDFKPCIFNDEIVIVYNVDEVGPIIVTAINEVLRKGVDSKEKVVESILRLSLSSIAVREFANNFEDLTKCQHILCSIFKHLLHHGWHLKASTNLRRPDKRCTLFFWKDRTSPPKVDTSVMAASLSSEDKLYLTNADGYIRETVAGNITNSWSQGIQKMEAGGQTDFKFKLKGTPWIVHSFGSELTESRLIVMNMIRSLEGLGYKFYASSHPSGDAMAVDTVYFSREREFTPMGESFLFGLLKANEIYLVQAPVAVRKMVRGVIERYWDQGIQSDRAIDHLEVYKLNGNPWISSSQRRLKARYLIVRLFEEMRKNGWKIHSTLDLCGTCDDVSCFLMRNCEPSNNPFMAISLHGESKMRLIKATPEVEEIFSEKLRQEWPNSFSISRGPENCMEITLPSTFTYCLAIFCIIFDRLSAHSWDVVASADLSANYTKQKNHYYANDLHTLIFERRTPPTDYTPDTLPSSGSDLEMFARKY